MMRKSMSELSKKKKRKKIATQSKVVSKLSTPLSYATKGIVAFLKFQDGVDRVNAVLLH